MNINGPPRPANHRDRFLDAQEALEGELISLVDRAVVAGWGEVEAVAAIVALAENRMLAIAENAEVSRLLEDLQKRWPR